MFRRLPRLLLLLAVILGATSASAARRDYVGANDCATCHPDEFASWQKTAHAGAEERLGEQRDDARCIACHSTGDAPAGPAYFSGVQCEACHGGGAGYREDDIMRNPRLSRLMGLVDLSTPAARARVCMRCHESGTRLGRFDVEKAWRQIAHGRKGASR